MSNSITCVCFSVFVCLFVYFYFFASLYFCVEFVFVFICLFALGNIKRVCCLLQLVEWPFCLYYLLWT